MADNWTFPWETGRPGVPRVPDPDEAAAAIGYLKTTEEWQSADTKPYQAFLVQNRDPEDTYAQDLGEKYINQFPKGNAAFTLQPGNYDSSKPAFGNVLEDLAATICRGGYQAVLFAGRSIDLHTFLKHLGQHPCDTRITVVSGDDASNLNVPLPGNAAHLWAGNPHLNVLYTALSSPQTWQIENQEYVSQDTIKKFADKCLQCYPTLFSDPLDDGDAIMSHDAVLTATAAARNAATPGTPQPEPAALLNGRYRIRGEKSVPGASGWICFRPSEASAVNEVPYNDEVPYN